MRRRDWMAGTIAMALACKPTLVLAQSRNGFSGNPIVEFLSGQSVRLVEAFSYRDPDGVLWEVPRRYVSNGASIPSVLWSVAGGPFSGAYRDASIIHDYYCERMTRSWEDTHRVFYDAMIARGVSEAEATKKYWAVHYLGPRWNRDEVWWGFWGIDRQPRHSGRKGIVGARRAEPPRDPEWIAAERRKQDRLRQFEREQFERVSAAIEGLGLGPDIVPALQPNDLGLELPETYPSSAP